MVNQPAPARRPGRVLPARPVRAAALIGAFVALLYVVEALDQTVFGGTLDADGIRPRAVDGLDGILWAPLLHAGWAHLLANTVPLLVLGFLALAAGVGRFLAVTALVWLLGGFLTWLTGTGLTVGASGVVFGWLAFLLARGFLARSVGPMVLSVVLLFVYGGVLWGVLPGTPGVSWQAHLFGAVSGVVAARCSVAADRRRAREGSGTGPGP